MMGFFLLFMLVMAGVIGVLGGLQYFGVLRHREAVPGDGIGRVDLHRVEEALAALDARLDRLEDQQKFLERLLEERPERGAIAPPEASGGGDAEAERGVDSILFDVEREER